MASGAFVFYYGVTVGDLVSHICYYELVDSFWNCYVFNSGVLVGVWDFSLGYFRLSVLD